MKSVDCHIFFVIVTGVNGLAMIKDLGFLEANEVNLNTFRNLFLNALFKYIS